MKILVVNTIDYSINGIANVIASFCKGIYTESKDINIEITSHGIIDDKYKKLFDEIGVKINFLPARKKVFKYTSALKKLVKYGDYDIVHIHGNSATMLLETYALKKSKAKVVVHGHNTKCSHMKAHKLLFKKFNKSYDYALACSKEAGEFAFGKNFTVIENGLEVNKFVFSEKAREQLRKQYNLEDNIVCIHVGLFNYQKNQELLLRAATKLGSRYKIVFAGGGSNLEYCKQLASKLSIQDKVLFLGMQNDVSKLYSMADCFVFPSNFESFGLALVEAQINGLPCLVSTEVSRYSKVNDKLVKYLPLQTDAWAKEISKITTRKTSKEDLKIYSKFDTKNSTDALIKFYKSII